MSRPGAMISSLVWVAVFIAACSATTDFQCWNFKSTNEIRQLYLNNINNLRKAIADGSANCKGTTCPQGKNVYRLYWDCMLEVEAQKAVDKCTDTATAPTGTSILIKKQTPTTCNLTPLFKQQVTEWWNVVTMEGLQSNPIFDKDGLASFAALAHGKATRIGCAQKNCNGDLYMACVVYDKTPEKNQPIYEVGTGCASAADCTTFAGSKCNTAQKLCIAGYIDTTATTTTTVAGSTSTTATASTATATTTAAGSTTSTAPPDTPNVTERLEIMTGRVVTWCWSPSFLRRLCCTTHSITFVGRTRITASGSNIKAQTQMCPSNGHITTDEIRNIFLTLHNQHRSNLARGLVNNGNPQSYARQASKMIKLRYNCTAEQSAFQWAMQCMDQDSPPKTGVSENRYTFPNINLDMTVVARRASNRWWEEIVTVGLSQTENRFYDNLGVKHWARMAWDSTQSFGCAAYKCPNFINAVCHYMGGGVVGEQIYKMGPACNRCATIGSTQCDQGLCVV